MMFLLALLQVAAAAPADLREALRATPTEVIAYVDAASPGSTTRDGRPRFTDSRLAEPEAAAAVLNRVLRGEDPPNVRLALLRAMDGGEAHAAMLHTVLRDADSAALREAAVRFVARAPGPDAVALLQDALADQDARIRVAAVRTAASVDHPSLRPLLREALQDEVSGVRAGAAWSLGALKDAEATDALRALRSTEDVVVRREADRALGRIGAR